MSNHRELRYQPAKELRVQTSLDGSRTITGYAAVYNSASVGLPWTEKVAPGAFSDALRPNADVLCLRDHQQEILLGRTKAGTLTLTDDTVGLRFSCKLPLTNQASDLAASIERGDLDGVSFGFSVPTGGDTWSNNGVGNITRTLLKVNLYEISPTSFPAYPSSSVSVRSCPPELRGLIRSQSDDEDECDCDCPECLDGDCENCSDDDCTDPNCDHNERSVRNQMYMRLALALRK